MAGQAVEVGFALKQEGVLKVVPGGIDGCRVGRAGFHRGDDGGEARAGRNDVELFVVLKEHLEVFGQAQAEHGALPADEIARLIRRDDDDGLAVGAVNRADLLEDGERGVRFGESLADDDLPKLGEVDRAAAWSRPAAPARAGSSARWR